MSWNNLIFILVPLLYLNVLAAEAYVGDSRNWNPRDLSTTLQRQPPHPFSPPHHSLPRPLPRPLELSRNPAVTEIPHIETKPTEVVSEYPHGRSVYPGTRPRFNFQRQPPYAETDTKRVATVSYPPVAISSMRDDDTSAIPTRAGQAKGAPPVVASDPAVVTPQPFDIAPEPAVIVPDQAVVAPQPFDIAPEPAVIAPEPEPISNEDIEIIRQQVTEAPPPPTTYVTPAQQLSIVPTKPPSLGRNLFRPRPPSAKPWITSVPKKPPTYTNKPPLQLPSRPLVTPTKPPTQAKNNVPLARDDLEPPQLMDYQCDQENAFYSIENECGAYVECQSYIARMNSCPEGLHFNARAVWPEYPCANPLQAKCEKSYLIPSPPRPIITADCPSETGMYAKSGDCSQYVVCEEGVGIVMKCPPGLVFSSQTSTCDWAENVPSCTLDIFRGFTCPAPPLEEDGSVSDEIFKFRHGQSCKEYVACHRGHPRLLRCDAGLSFDDESKVCVDTDYVTNCKY